MREVADLCIVDLFEDDREVRRLKVTSREASRSGLCEQLMQIPLDRSRPYLLHSVLATRRPVFLQNPSDELLASLSQSEEHLRVLQAAQICSLVAVPLMAHNRLLGSIAFISLQASRVYGPADLRLAEEIAHRAALSIENARLYRAAQRATQLRRDVLGIVAHDLRSPLSTILMTAKLLRRGASEPAHPSQIPAGSIERAATRMNPPHPRSAGCDPHGSRPPDSESDPGVRRAAPYHYI